MRYGPDDTRAPMAARAPHTPARLHLHPADAADAGVGDGDAATVVSEHGVVDVTVVVDERIRAGVVTLVHGRRGHSPGQTDSARAEVDPLTTMPRTSGVPVRVEAKLAPD